jgi:hypothetical protein
VLKIIIKQVLIATKSIFNKICFIYSNSHDNSHYYNGFIKIKVKKETVKIIIMIKYYYWMNLKPGKINILIKIL